MVGEPSVRPPAERDARLRIDQAMLSPQTMVGLAAAFCTTVSYVPQVMKCWKTRSTEDLSLKMLVTLGLGLLLWVVYGFLLGDPVIVVANGCSLALLANVLGFKLFEIYGQRRSGYMHPD